MVEHNLAKVGVASSSLVSRSILSRNGSFEILICWGSSNSLPAFFLRIGGIFRSYAMMAGWQSGHAAACKAVYAGSIPTPASTDLMLPSPGW